MGGSGRNKETKSGGVLVLGTHRTLTECDPQRVGQSEELTSLHDLQGPMNTSSTIGYLPLHPTSAMQKSPKAEGRQVLTLASLVQTQGLLPEDKASLLLHRHHILGQVVGL